MKKVVFVIAENNFSDEELFQTKAVLDSAGFECSIGSKKKGTSLGALGGKVESQFSLNEIGNDFDGIIFVGGPGAKQFFHDPDALGLARKYFELGRVIGAISLAPVILANSGILMGKRATSFSNEKPNMLGKCGVFTGKQVEVDGRIVTASVFSSSKFFGEEILKKLQ